MAAVIGGNVYVFDRREGDGPEVSIRLADIRNFSEFASKVRETFSIADDIDPVVVTTERVLINDASHGCIESGDTLYLLNTCDQDLPAPVRERVEFLPHYETLTKSGMYEYYASEGQNPLSFAFAELVDNALYATSTNSDLRKIEIRLMFDDTTNHSSICVLDNGRGMNSKELNEWAVYRLSKHSRSRRIDLSNQNAGIRVSRSLNSDISYFGVGGKQAIFYIGNSTRMISKCEESNDVHEMVLSKDDFKQKEKNKESIYSGTIFNRTICDINHVSSEDEHLKRLILEEVAEKSFTKVFITAIKPDHIAYLKSNFLDWCKELAHIYHYYLHGPLGNTTENSNKQKKVEITVSLFDKGKIPKNVSLSQIDYDMQTLYVRTAASTFDFKVHTEGGDLEGQLRYHPFLYDRETYPINLSEPTISTNDDEDDDLVQNFNGPRGDRPIFRCFWNGRLIPYTAIKSFDWCKIPRKKTSLPTECYHRFSGVLWAGDSFKVSTNKLTFMDLELKLSDRSTVFTRLIAGQEQRVPIVKAFTEWLKHCHETFDKQICFFDKQGTTKRTDLTGKKSQGTWTVFNAIEWHGNVYKKGEYVKTCRTSPIIIGSINRFFLSGDYVEEKVYMTGGEVEIIQEPKSLYGELRVFPLDKLDQFFNQEHASSVIKTEELKLPSHLILEWPQGNELKENAMLPAGAPIGPIKVDILNGKMEPCNKIPGAQGKRLLVDLQVIGVTGKNKDKRVVQHTAQHGGKSWPYWFRKMENVNALGDYVLRLQIVLADTSGPKIVKNLPSRDIKFTVGVGDPWKFTIEQMDTALRSGVPFKVHLSILDYYGNVAVPTQESVSISANDVSLIHGTVDIEDKHLVVNDVLGFPKVDRIDGKDITIKVTISNLKDHTQITKVRFLPGLPFTLDIKPIDDVMRIDNGSPVKFYVLVKDESGNITADPKSQVNCKLTGSAKLPYYGVDCSSGKGMFAIPSIDIKGLHKEITLTAKFDMPNHKMVESVKKQIIVAPGARPALFKVRFIKEESGNEKVIADGEDVFYNAGESISGITFEIIDEGSRKLVIDETLASKIKVNWATKMQKDRIICGNLPDIKVPCSVCETKFCQLSINAVEFSFTIKPQAKNLHSLHCKYFGINKVSPDHPKLAIIIEIQDFYGNQLAIPVEDVDLIDVFGEGIDISSIKREINEDNNLVLKDIHFIDLTPGNREITFVYKDVKAYQRVDVLPGPPASIRYIELYHDQVISMRNGHKWDGCLRMQVVDAGDHPCKDSNIQICLKNVGNMKYVLPSKSSHMSQISQHTDENGQVTFSDFSLFSPLKHGTFKILPKASLGKYDIIAPPLIINLLADPNKPVKVMILTGVKKVLVGDVMPEIRCCVYAEDDNIMTSIEPSNVVLKMWSTSATTKANPNKTMIYCPSEPTPDDEPYHFYFRDIKAPQVAGKCFLTTQYKGCAALGEEVVHLQSETVNIFVENSSLLDGHTTHLYFSGLVDSI